MKNLTVQSAMSDFKLAYRAKSKLVARQKDDFLFRFGKQWDEEKYSKLKDSGIEPVVDNRIQPNIFLITGLERQNRSDFRAFPEGEEDSLKAEVATSLFKHSVKHSKFIHKVSEVFEDGVTCGESHLELYLDNTDDLLNGKPCWKKINSDSVFPDPNAIEYDYSDAKYIYKVTKSIGEDDLISLYPEKEKVISMSNGGVIDLGTRNEKTLQPKDYPKAGSSDAGDEVSHKLFDLIERYYKRWVEKYFIGDYKTGEIKEAESKDSAESFLTDYKTRVEDESIQAQQANEMAQNDPTGQSQVLASALPQSDPNRFILIKRKVPEIWCFSFFPGIKEPLAHERAWFYPEWTGYHIIPYFAHHSTASIDGGDKHLLVQGIVYGVKGVQKKHNSAETLKVMHLNSAANSGWLSEEDAWVDAQKVEQFGSAPGVNLEYKKGRQKPERIYPMALSQGHTQIASESAEAIKQILGINADLLAAQEGGTDSGRAIALRQKQGLVMVQKLFDNLSRTKENAGKFLLTQLGKMYDTEKAMKVLGESFLIKNFPPPMMMGEIDPATGIPSQVPMVDPKTNEPMQYDRDMAELLIAEVLSGKLGEYNVSVGEAIISETMKMANAGELLALAEKMPGIIPPDMIVESSNLESSTKNRILSAIKNAQSMAQSMPTGAVNGGS
jgi:hypothetical protein